MLEDKGDGKTEIDRGELLLAIMFNVINDRDLKFLGVEWACWNSGDESACCSGHCLLVINPFFFPQSKNLLYFPKKFQSE